MSICALWIISPITSSQNQASSVFSRYYPTVLKRAKLSHDFVTEFSTDNEISEAILDEMQVNRVPTEFVKQFDSCMLKKQSPVYGIFENKIWPIVAIRKFGLVYACLPLVERDSDAVAGTSFTRTNEQESEVDSKLVERESQVDLKLKLTDMPSISIAYSLLHNIADVVAGTSFTRTSSNEISPEKLQELQNYLSLCMPLGTPIESNPSTIKAILNSKDASFVPKFKMPAWRCTAYKGKQQIFLFVQEQIRAMQYDRPEIEDVCEIFGTVTCRAEVDGAPEMTLNILAPIETAIFNQMVYHPCIQLSDDMSPTVTTHGKDCDLQYAAKPIRFIPPLDEFPLCHYKSRLLTSSLPVQAYYQIKGDDKSAKILIQLKLSSKIKNNFEFFEVYIPFFNKTLKRIDFIPPSANVSIASDKSSIRWSIGSKFPSKSLELSLEVNVQFSREKVQTDWPDAFCVGDNLYIQVSFKVADFTYSGMKIDSRSISTYPNIKLKTNTACEFVSAEYQIWNTHGDAISAQRPNLA